MGKYYFFGDLGKKKEDDMTEADAKRILANKAKADQEHLAKIEKLYGTKTLDEEDLTEADFAEKKFQLDIDLMEIEVQNSGEVCVWYNGFAQPEVIYVTENITKAEDFLDELQAFADLAEEL